MAAVRVHPLSVRGDAPWAAGQLLNLSDGSGVMPAGAGGSLDSWYNYKIIRVIFTLHYITFELFRVA